MHGSRVLKKYSRTWEKGLHLVVLALLFKKAFFSFFGFKNKAVLFAVIGHAQISYSSALSCASGCISQKIQWLLTRLQQQFVS